MRIPTHRGDMKVTISVKSRLHGYYLAQQLFKQGYLKTLFTSYPKYLAEKDGIPEEMITSVIIARAIGGTWSKLPGMIRNCYNPQYIVHEIFDRWVAGLITKSDITVAFSSVGLHTLRKAKDMGAITIIERGSSHILYQTDILKEEYDHLGVIPRLVPHSKIVEKELQEYEEANYISIPSLFVKETFLKKGISEEKLIHVPYGVCLDEFKQIQKTDNVFRIVYAGTMSIQKGTHYLLQAVSELKLPNMELLLIGEAFDEIIPFFKKYEGSFRWLDTVHQEELYKHYSQGSVFVLMSIQDGFGLVLLQAMACGLPVIYTTNTGGEDIVREGIDGFMIPIRDVDSLKEKLIYLYEHTDICQAMGQSAKERVSKEFTWDHYGNKMIKEYKRVLKKKYTDGYMA